MSRRTLGTVIAVAGALLLLDGALTIAWREPVSWALGRRDQERLSAQLKPVSTRLDAALARTLSGGARPRATLALAARTLHRIATPGEPLGRLRIARLHASFVVAQGTDQRTLRGGLGHYAPTALPGEHGTVGIAGHRTTYLQPFRHIDQLRAGDRITLTMPYGRFTYVVSGSRIVAPAQVGVLARTGGAERLVLTACHPLFSAAQRLVVFARLRAAEPLGPARARIS